MASEKLSCYDGLMYEMIRKTSKRAVFKVKSQEVPSLPIINRVMKAFKSTPSVSSGLRKRAQIVHLHLSRRFPRANQFLVA